MPNPGAVTEEQISHPIAAHDPAVGDTQSVGTARDYNELPMADGRSPDEE